MKKRNSVKHEMKTSPNMIPNKTKQETTKLCSIDNYCLTPSLFPIASRNILLTIPEWNKYWILKYNSSIDRNDFLLLSRRVDVAMF